MSDFFKQLISQLSTVWEKLSLQQRIITSSILGLTILGLLTLLVWSGNSSDTGGFKKLYSNLTVEDASSITEKLTQSGYKYKLENNGTTILVDSKNLYEARMQLAREGLPATRGFGYEIFDRANIGVTDFVQKLNAKRALEGELQRTITGLKEVKTARVHIVIPKNSIYLENQKEAKATVVLSAVAGKKLTKDQVNGISYLVSSSVDGLKTSNISIIDNHGKLLSNPYGDNETALASSRNMELQQNVERKLKREAEELLANILGPGKATVQIAADLDFDQIEKTMEKYNPEGKVVRSEERNDENIKNAPDGDKQKERSLANYEIDKTVEHLISEVGNVKRLTISVAVDGVKSKDDKGKDLYKPRTPEEISNIEDIVKNAVGYDLTRGDRIFVANMKFENEFMRNEQEDMKRQERYQQYMDWGKLVLFGFVIIMVVVLLKSMAKTISEAMNPPLPNIDITKEEEEEPVEVPEDIRRSNELLERVELMTEQSPVNIANVIRDWLMEPSKK